MEVPAGEGQSQNETTNNEEKLDSEPTWAKKSHQVALIYDQLLLHATLHAQTVSRWQVHRQGVMKDDTGDSEETEAVNFANYLTGSCHARKLVEQPITQGMQRDCRSFSENR